MKLYIWQGDGISDGYHDDGTMVVLAESPEQARAIAIAESATAEPYGGGVFVHWWGGEFTPSEQTAIEREPDRVMDIDTPKVVAFNGGGYD